MSRGKLWALVVIVSIVMLVATLIIVVTEPSNDMEVPGWVTESFQDFNDNSPTLDQLVEDGILEVKNE